MKLKPKCNWKQYFCNLLREHQHGQKTFVTLSGFWLRVNPLTKENLWWKYFLRYMNWIKFQKFMKPGLILETYCVRYPRAAPFFSYSKNFKFSCCLGGFHLWATLDLLKYALFWSHRKHALPFYNNNNNNNIYIYIYMKNISAERSWCKTARDKRTGICIL